MASEPGKGAPVACGAIGEFDPESVERIAALLEVPVREVHRDRGSILFLDRAPGRWRSADRAASGVAWSEREPDRTSSAGSWQDAAGHGGCGIATDGERRALHSSASGLASLYWRRSDRAVYFATQLEALARAGLGETTIDWRAWREILVLSYPLEGRTPFAEIARLHPNSRVVADRERIALEVGRLAWAEREEELAPREAAERIVAGIRAEAAAIEPLGPVSCPLTGGWDSRLIAAALAERGLIERAYTVNTDHGVDDDERIAGQVAAHLGVRHHVVAQEPPPFAAELERAAERVEYQTILHLPMARLAAGMPRGGVAADGFGGDVLIKGLYLSRRVLEAVDPVAEAFDFFAPGALPALWDASVWEPWRATAREAFLNGAAPYRGHRSEATLGIFSIRTHRVITGSPMRIVGAERRLFVPLIAGEIAGPALAVDPARKLGSGLYHEVFRAIDPAIDRIPSTNDGRRPAPRSRQRYRSREARAAYRDLLLRSPLRPWFSSHLEQRVASGRMAPLDRAGRRILRVQALCMLTLFFDRYRDLLGEPDPAPLFE